MLKTIRAVWLPLLFTLVMAALFLLVDGRWGYLFFIPYWLGIADILARVSDYRLAKYMLANCYRPMNGYCGLLPMECRYRQFHFFLDIKKARAVMYRYRSSRCQRNACTYAAKDVGLGNLGHEYFYELGYRWWHVLPDGTFSKNSPYLRWDFYKHLLRGGGSS